MSWKESPIIMSTELIKAIQAGRKTQTRRIIRSPYQEFGHITSQGYGNWEDRTGQTFRCPYGWTGDLLWVRETWGTNTVDHHTKPSLLPETTRIWYKADYKNDFDFHAWRPSIFMPKWASRITLEIAKIRVEQVQDISVDDAIAEGIKQISNDRHWAWRDYTGNGLRLSPKMSFETLWDSINDKRGYPWSSNPWVWVIEFELREESVHYRRREESVHYRRREESVNYRRREESGK